MATFPLSNQYSLCTPPRLTPSFFSKPPPLTTPSLALQPRQNPHIHTRSSLKPISGLALHNSSPLKNWHSFKSFCTVKDSAIETTDEDEVSSDDMEESKSDADEENPSSLKSLLQAYKEAILSGDDKTTTDVEATICDVEIERNALSGRIEVLSAEVTSGKEKYIRLQADFDNFRKRSEKERLNVRSDAQGEVIESLLPMIDNFERAKQQLKLETEQEKNIDASYQGIYKQFVEIMRSLSVAVVPTVGKPFDPSVHEAIAREESHEFGDGIVIQEFRRGFVLGDRLLRPAMVKVSAGPGRASAGGPNSEPSSSGQATDNPPQESTESSPTESNEQPHTGGVDER